MTVENNKDFFGNRLGNNIFLLIYAHENRIFRTSTVKTLQDAKLLCNYSCQQN
jgi:hypothetical protein